MKTRPRRWAFFPYAHNLGDLTRALETAKGMRGSGADVRFFTHGGTHTDLVRQAGLECIDLQPAITDAQDEVIMAINQFRVPLGTPLPFSEEELEEMVRADLEALEDWQPDGVYCGLNFSSMISVPYLKLPRVTQVPTSLCPAFYRKGLASFPATMETNVLTRYLVPRFLKRRFFNAVMQRDVMRKTAAIFNRVRGRYGLPPVRNPVEFVQSDLVLLPDLPELSGLPAEDLPQGYIYTGPIFAVMDVPMPPQVKEVFSGDEQKIFCTLGSSGTAEVFSNLVRILRKHTEFRVVCATTTIIDPAELGPASDRFFAAPYLPAHEVNEMADIALTHGGQGTIQTAAWAGTPVVGIGFQAEQQANIDGLVRAGMGVRIPLHSITPRRLLRSIERALTPEARDSAARMQRLVRSVDGVANSVAAMDRLVSVGK